MTFVERIELVRRIEEQIRKHPQISGALSLADMFEVKEIPPPEERNSLKGRLFIRNYRHLENKVFVEENDSAVARLTEFNRNAGVERGTISRRITSLVIPAKAGIQ
jgi:hypothetical protein